MEKELAKDSDVKEGKTIEVDFFGRPVILTKKEGKVLAFVNVCAHLGGPVKREGDIFRCEWHNSTYDVGTGKRLTEPAPKGSSLINLPIVIKEGKVFYKYP